MSNVAIVTDSTANIPEELVQELDIHVVPVWLYWQGQGLRDGLDILVENVTIQVVDSRTGTMGHGFVVLEAARAAAAGRPLEEVLDRAQETLSKVNVLVTLDTLKYLHRGGRVPAVAALVGSLLKIKPIVYITRDGHADVLERPRTKVMAVQRIVEIMEEQVGAKPVHAAVVHADALEEAKRLKEELSSRFHCVELLTTEFTPVIGAHTGPGVLGVVFYTE